MSSFAQLNLHPEIFKAINVCGYTQPTPIQAQSIPDILKGHDLIASAQTGTGKTAAFVLPALHRLSGQKASKKTRVLILTPTRELASQITKAASIYGKFLRFNIVSLVGGMPYHPQIKDLARGADIIVATPGRLLDHLNSGRVDLSHIEMLVLDEADRMLDMGFIDDVEEIAKLTPKNRQTLLFSATVDKNLSTIVRHLMKSPVRIDLSGTTISAPKIKQEYYKVTQPQQKLRLLNHILRDENIYKAIIFSATKANADKLAAQLRDQGFAAAALHGDLRQNVRNRTIDQLRRGKIQFLVATDVAARGIDISDVTHVVNYDLPRFCEDYVHRIGRTGRAGKEGMAISFVLPTDTRHLQRIERFTGQRLKMVSNHQELAPLQPSEALSIKKEHASETRHPRADKGGYRNTTHKDNERYKPTRRSDGINNDKEGYQFKKKSSSSRPTRFAKDHERKEQPARAENPYTKTYIKKKADTAKPAQATRHRSFKNKEGDTYRSKPVRNSQSRSFKNGAPKKRRDREG